MLSWAVPSKTDKMCSKRSVSSAIESMKQMQGITEYFSITPTQPLIKICSSYLYWIVFCGWTSFFSVSFLVKPASSVKITWLLKTGFSPHCTRNHKLNSWCVRKSNRLRACACWKRYGYSNCWWRNRHTALRARCSAASTKYVREFASTGLDMRSHIKCSCISPYSVVYCRRAKQLSSPWLSLKGRSMAWKVRGCGSLRWGYFSTH